MPRQFERAPLQLEIEPICAHSPQAKGRVERLFQTLQDRLVNALRLAGISDIDKANAWLAGYMARHNQRFAVAPKNDADMHRPWLGGPEQLASIGALHHQRQLSAQLSCRFEGQVLQIEPGQMQAPQAKTVGQRVDQAADKERKRLASLAASIAHQDSQRRAGIYAPDSPANAPRAAAAGRCGLRPPQPAAAA